MQPPRRPNRPPTAPRPPRLALSRFRDARSGQLDGRQVRPRGEQERQPVPEFVRWAEFHRFMAGHWLPGEHLSLVGQTGSGKTTAMRELLDIRDYVCVIATKRLDDSMRDFERKGYRTVDDFNPAEWNVDEAPKVIYHVPLSSPTPEAEAAQRERIRQVLRGVYLTGGWCIALDEVAYLSRDLKLDRELNAIWREGRSSGATIVAGTQRPVNVPRNMWEQATHNVDFRVTGKEDRATASEYLGSLSGVAFEVLAMLPKYEFLYVDSIESIAMRSRVELHARA